MNTGRHVVELYRGDSRPTPRQKRARTHPERGLGAKFGDKGHSKLITSKPLLQLVLEHVGYEAGTPSEAVSKRSPLISFTESREIALGFAERSGKKSLVPCEYHEGEFFLWRLETGAARPVGVGHYVLHFEADGADLARVARSQLREGMIPGREGHAVAALAKLAEARYATEDDARHAVELIDVLAFVESRLEQAKAVDSLLCENTLRRARRAAEWLVRSLDSMVDGPGLASRIPPNPYLTRAGSFRRSSG